MTVSPSSRPLDSGTSRCQQASSSAATEPSALRYITTCLPQIVRGNSAGLTSASHAAAYQAFMGKGFVMGRSPAAYVCVVYTIKRNTNQGRPNYAYQNTSFYIDVYIRSEDPRPPRHFAEPCRLPADWLVVLTKRQ